MEAWKQQLEAVLRQVPGYNPWDQAGDAWLDHEAALHAINWFPEHLRHVEGSTRGEPFLLRPWQAAIVGNVFGWKRKDDAGRVVRRFRRAFIKVARGNGKTPLGAGMILYGFFNDGENGAQCYLAAGQKEQAGFLFRNAAGMIDQDEELSSRVKIFRGDQHRSLTLNDDPLSFLKTIPADAAGQHGGIPHISAVDEVHVQQNRDLLDTFDTGMSKKVRPQPLLLLITTADVDRPSICNEMDDVAHAVRDNGGNTDNPGYDPSFFPVLYELAQEDDFTDEALWPRANPNIDVSVSRESLRKTVQRAKENPALENAVRRLHFNQKTSEDARLIPLDQWDACKAPIKLADFDGQPCYAGLDLSSKEDLTSLTLAFPLPYDELAVFSWSWCPSEMIRKRTIRKSVPYDVWVRHDFIEETAGDSVDYGVVREKLCELDKRFKIQFVYIDPFGARETAQILMEQHGFGERIVELTQSMTQLSAPTKDLIFRVKHGKLKHDGNPVLRWAAGNLSGYFKGKIPSGQTLADCLDKLPIMPSKQSSKDKIDPIAALVNAIAAKIAHPVTKKSSIYESRGVLTV